MIWATSLTLSIPSLLYSRDEDHDAGDPDERAASIHGDGLLPQHFVDDGEFPPDVEDVLQLDGGAVMAARPDHQIAGPHAENPVPEHIAPFLLDRGAVGRNHDFSIADLQDVPYLSSSENDVVHTIVDGDHNKPDDE